MSENTENENETKVETLTLTKEELQALIEDNLKPIKSKLDDAYSKRDTALEELETLKKEKREAELAKLKEEGKHKEAYELQIEELKRVAQEEADNRKRIEETNDKLARDMEIRQTLTLQPFKNKKALELAYLEIVKQVVKNENNQWVAKDGSSIESLVESFVKDEDNAFLLKASNSSGSGSTSITTQPTTTKPKSLFEMSQKEVLALVS